MTRSALQTRQRILEQAYRLLYREGFHRTSIDAVANAAGITKRTLYNHFESKDALIGAVLDAQAELAAAEIRRWCGDDAVTPAELVSRIFDGLRRWSRHPAWQGSGFTRAAMELAWAPGHPARHATMAQKRAVESALAEVLSNAGASSPSHLARELVLLIEGSNTLRLIHGEEVWYDVAETAAIALARAANR